MLQCKTFRKRLISWRLILQNFIVGNRKEARFELCMHLLPFSLQPAHTFLTPLCSQNQAQRRTSRKLLQIPDFIVVFFEGYKSHSSFGMVSINRMLKCLDFELTSEFPFRFCMPFKNPSKQQLAMFLNNLNTGPVWHSDTHCILDRWG